VFGIERWRSKTEHIEHLRDRLTLIESDLRDLFSVRSVFEQARPDYVIHLAAQSFVAASWQTPAETFHTNVISQVNVLEAMRALAPHARCLVVGSSEEYGLVEPHELPIRETNPLRPLSPYAVSKVAQDLMGYQYFKSYGLHIVRSRAFNHEGPRRGDVFVTSNFARQIAEIERGLREPVIAVGNLKTRRDYTDVRDIVRANLLALERPEADYEVFNVGTGMSTSVRQLAGLLAQELGVRVQPEVTGKCRAGDIRHSQADITAIRAALGYAPRWTTRAGLEALVAAVRAGPRTPKTATS
jgi:GDP-4-dehydro-6-deoxy-D-mannose reductase